MEEMDAVSKEVAVPQAAPVADSAKRRVVVGPWKSVAEFHFVCQSLFGKNATDNTRKDALTEMRVWHIRRCHLCPAMVLATSTLLEVQLKDSDNLNRRRLVNSELRMMYACSITRFFNFISSTLQTHKMRSMYDIARELKIDSFIVDLRHICAHSEVLPPLEALRRCVEYCLRWLRDQYWLPQAATMEDVDMASMRQKKQTKVGKPLAELCSIYDAAYECLVARAFGPKTIKKFLKGKRLTRLMKYFREHKVETVTDLFTPLVEDFDHLATINRNMKDIADIFSEELSKMVAFYTAVDKSSSDDHIKLVIGMNQELFRMLAKHNIIETYFSRLMKMAEGCAEKIICRAGASFWGHKILKGYLALCVYRQYQKEIADQNKLSLWNKPFVYISAREVLPKSLRKALIYAGVDLERTLYFANTPRRPWIWDIEIKYLRRRLSLINTFTVHIVKDLIAIVDPKLTEYDKKSLEDLIDARFRIPKNNDVENNSTIYTVDQLPLDMTHETSIWSEPDDGRDWSSCALGLLPRK